MELQEIIEYLMREGCDFDLHHQTPQEVLIFTFEQWTVRISNGPEEIFSLTAKRGEEYIDLNTKNIYLITSTLKML